MEVRDLACGGVIDPLLQIRLKHLALVEREHERINLASAPLSKAPISRGDKGIFLTNGGGGGGGGGGGVGEEE